MTDFHLRSYIIAEHYEDTLKMFILSKKNTPRRIIILKLFLYKKLVFKKIHFALQNKKYIVSLHISILTIYMNKTKRISIHFCTFTFTAIHILIKINGFFKFKTIFAYWSQNPPKPYRVHWPTVNSKYFF